MQDITLDRILDRRELGIRTETQDSLVNWLILLFADLRPTHVNAALDILQYLLKRLRFEIGGRTAEELTAATETIYNAATKTIGSRERSHALLEERRRGQGKKQAEQ